jgi:hypothetical protein
MRSYTIGLPYLMVGAMLATASCADVVSPARMPEASLSIAVAPPPTGGAASAPIGDAEGRVLRLERAQLLLRRARLKRADDDDCGRRSDGSCGTFAVGPVLLDLPLQGGVITPFVGPIRPGVYDEIELRIREPEDDNGDRARFRAEHPDWPRKATVRVRGTFDAADGRGARPFDVFLEVDAEIERALRPALVVDGATDPASVNVTVRVRTAGWFRAAGGRLLDPRRIAGDRELAERVAQNVERSLEAFRDDDRSGRGGGASAEIESP